MNLAGIVQRPDSLLTGPLPPPFTAVPAVAQVSELKEVDTVLVAERKWV